MRVKYKDTIIQNVSDFLIWVKETCKSEVMSDDGMPIIFENDHGYFRGQSCLCWELKPSVFRGEPSLDEHSLLNKATLRLGYEVDKYNTYLERMIYFQHYGLCTRLLDVTSNPLVALFMACYEESNQSCDGVVYCGNGIGYQNPQIAELTAKYVFQHEYSKMTVGLQRFAKEEKIDISRFCQPIYIQPSINNPRIEAQNGAFIMAPLFSEIIDDNSAIMNCNSLDDTGFFDNRRAVIPSTIKDIILDELSILGVDSGTIYRCVEEKLKAIVSEEKRNSSHYKNIQL